MSYLPNKLGMPEHIIRFYGNFNLHRLVEGMRKFIELRHYDFHEIYRMKKGGDGWKFETRWECSNKTNHFIKKTIAIDFNIQEIRDVELTVNGHKEKFQHGRGTILIWGGIEAGYDESWSKFEKLRGFFLTYVWKSQYLGKYADEQWYEIQDAAREVRVLLDFEVK